MGSVRLDPLLPIESELKGVPGDNILVRSCQAKADLDLGDALVSTTAGAMVESRSAALACHALKEAIRVRIADEARR